MILDKRYQLRTQQVVIEPGVRVRAAVANR